MIPVWSWSACFFTETSFTDHAISTVFSFVAQVMALGDDWCGFADAEENHDTVTWLNSRQRDIWYICFGKNRIETRAMTVMTAMTAMRNERPEEEVGPAPSDWQAYRGAPQRRHWKGRKRVIMMTYDDDIWRWWEVSGRWDLPGTGLRSLGSRKQCDFRNWSRHAPVPTRPSHLRSRDGCKQWC